MWYHEGKKEETQNSLNKQEAIQGEGSWKPLVLPRVSATLIPITASAMMPNPKRATTPWPSTFLPQQTYFLPGLGQYP